MADRSIAPAHPSATIVLVRDSEPGLEVLLVRRNKKLKFHGGAWVFPGGRIDDGDDDGDILSTARRAAARELKEEAGLDVDLDDLRPVSRWITPEILPKRFDTYFFLAPARSYDVVIDGGEIHDYRWSTPAEALGRQRAGEIELPPPTFVTLTVLADCADVGQAIDRVPADEPLKFTPRICKIEGGACSLYEGDAGWDKSDPEAHGPRHRLWLLESGWRYEKG